MPFLGKALCRFTTGTLSSVSSEDLGVTGTAGECATLVLRIRSEAGGAVWGYGPDQHGSCFAHFQAIGHKFDTWPWDGKWIGCLFTCEYTYEYVYVCICSYNTI